MSSRVRVVASRGLVAGLLFAWLSCSTDSRSPDEATLTIMVPLDEYGLSWAWSATAQFLVFSPLVARNEAGLLEPRLATSWEHSPDYRQWTVHVRTDVLWHDGAPFTAHDVKFTLDLLWLVWADRTDAYSVEVLDDSTYSITYERPAIGSPLDDFTVIYPKHLLTGLDPSTNAEWDFWKAPVGTGPFRHVRTVAGTGMEFGANPEYFRGKPRIDRVVLKFGVPQLQMLLSGDVDVLPNVSELNLLALESDPRFAVFRWYNPIRMKVILWNHRSPFFADASVRRALAHAVDREQLHRVLGLPDEVRVFDGLYSEQQLRRGELPTAVPYDRERAKELLDAAGWRDRDGDGIRDRKGIPFRFTLLVQGGNGGSWTAQGGEGVALFLQDQLRQVGIATQLQPWELGIKEPFVAGRADAAVDDIAGLVSRLRFFGPDSWIGYDNPRVVELLERIVAAFDPDSVDHFYTEVSQIFAEEHPVMFLYSAIATTVVNRRLKGLSTPHRSLAVWYLEDLWIEE